MVYSGFRFAQAAARRGNRRSGCPGEVRRLVHEYYVAQCRIQKRTTPTVTSEKAQIPLDGAQIQLDCAQSPRLRFSVGSHKVPYAKCLYLPESVRADSNRAGMTQIEPETTTLHDFGSVRIWFLMRNCLAAGPSPCRFEFDLSLFCSIGAGPRYFLVSSVSDRSNPFSGPGPDNVEIDIVVAVSYDIR
jgi:hypothetical protein